jgi:opacity protein-like surface antigen
MSEIFGGGLLGYEYELPNRFVVGARISAPFGGTVTAGTVPAIFTGLPAGSTVTGKFNWATTVNATIGYDMGQWMPYMGVGVAFADLGVTVNSPAGATSAEEQQTGLNVLAGIKYAWMPNWELGVQYNYTTFARQNYNFTGPGVAGVLIGQLPISINQSSITGIIDYKFH